MIFVKIFQPAKALEIFLLSADFAIIIRGNHFPEPLSVRQIQIFLTVSLILKYVNIFSLLFQYLRAQPFVTPLLLAHHYLAKVL